MDGGNVIYFDKNFDVYCQNGKFYFGNIEINTSDDGEENEDEFFEDDLDDKDDFFDDDYEEDNL